MKFEWLCISLGLITSAGGASSAMAAPKPDDGRAAYASCVACHEPEGWGNPDGTYPQIAGQHAEVILKQLDDIRSHRRRSPLMYPFSNEDHLEAGNFAAVAAYISALPMNPQNGVGPGDDLLRGKQVYASACAQCHGPEGQGDAAKGVAVLQGQHFAYLERQVDWIRGGRHHNGGPETTARLRGLSRSDVSAALDHVSRLEPPAAKLATPGWWNADFPKFVRADGPLPVAVCRIND